MDTRRASRVNAVVSASAGLRGALVGTLRTSRAFAVLIALVLFDILLLSRAAAIRKGNQSAKFFLE